MLYWLLRRRFRSSWPLLAIASFGILAAVTLMAVGAVYSRGLAEGGVRHTLAAADPTKYAGLERPCRVARSTTYTDIRTARATKIR